MDNNKIDNNDILVIQNINNITNKKQLWLNKETIYCNNCGKNGHLYKKCYEPILSYGIICLNMDNQNIDNFCVSKYKFPNDIQSLKNICIIKYILKNISCNNKKDLDKYEEKVLKNIKTVMVRRKFTYNYIYLIRGLYILDIEIIIKSINLLTKTEYNNILTKEFEELWNEIWSNNTNQFTTEKDSFNLLKNYILPQIKHRINIIYDVPEWGFPKGKRNNNESNIESAIREFEEETGLNNTQYTLLDRLYPLIETIKGSDGLDYKYIYYVAILNKNVDIKIDINNNEIGDINTYSISNTINILRDYNIERKELINNLKLFLMYNIRYLEKFYYEK